MRLLVIGSAPAVWGFSLAGIDGQIVTTEDGLTAAMEGALKDPNIGIVLVTSKVVDLRREWISNLMARSELPLIVEIVGPEGPSPNRPSINEMLRRTIGVRL
jgi:V/A-type H+-transporting ATPase subunit F